LDRNGKSLGELPIMSIENPILAHFRHLSSLLTNLPSTTVESALQISPFYAKHSQSQVGKINLITYIAMRYEKMDIWLFRQTKPIQTQFPKSGSSCLCSYADGLYFSQSKRPSRHHRTKRQIPKDKHCLKNTGRTCL